MLMQHLLQPNKSCNLSHGVHYRKQKFFIILFMWSFWLEQVSQVIILLIISPMAIVVTITAYIVLHTYRSINACRTT